MTTESPLLVDTGRGYTVKWNNRYLLSPYAPEEKCLKAAERAELQPHTLYLLVHPLFGYGLSLLKKKLPENSFILALEPNQELFSLYTSFISEDLPQEDRLQIYRVSDLAHILKLAKDIGLWKFRRCQLINIGCGLREPFQELWLNSLQKQLNLYWKNRLTQIRLGKQWRNNILKNLAFLPNSLSLPKTNKPLLLCAAGSSLDILIPRIKELRDFWYILSVDTALGTLKAGGITPDSVINIDGQYYNSLDFYFQEKDILRLSDLTAYSGTLRKAKQSIFCSRFCETPFLKQLEQHGKIPFIPALGSVSLGALYLALQIAVKSPIVLAGLDFAYNPGQTHSKATLFHQHFLWKQNRLNPDGGLTEQSFKRNPFSIGKKLMKSDSVLKAYHKDLCDMLETIEHSIFHWNPIGLDLPLPLFEEDLLKDWNIKKAPTSEPLSLPYDLNFLKEWKIKLEDLIELWKRYQQSGTGEVELDKKLKELDILYFDSPENPPEPGENQRSRTLMLHNARKVLNLLNSL